MNPEAFFNENKGILAILQNNLENPVYVFETENRFKKCLLMTIVGYFEERIKLIIKTYFEENGNQIISDFIEDRRLMPYHTIFNVKASNINGFLNMFGQDFKNEFNVMKEKDELLNEAIELFLELGRDRNYIAHGNFATRNINSNSNELLHKYNKAKYFIDKFDEFLNNH